MVPIGRRVATATAVTFSALASLTAACGTGEAANASSPTTTTTTWITASPAAHIRTLAELKQMLDDPSVAFIEMGEVSAAVFDINSGNPHTNDPAWQKLLALMSLAPVESVINGGWRVQVEAFQDGGSVAANRRVGRIRSTGAARALSRQLGIPLRVFACGDGGSTTTEIDPAHRRVVVSFNRHPDRKFTACTN